MKIALCQMKVVEGKDNNLATAKKMVEKAATLGAEIVVLPEMFNCPYSNAFFPLYAESEGGESFRQMASWAKVSGIILIGGSIPEKDEDKLFNTSYIFDQNGFCIGKHRKTHLFDIDIPGGISFLESETLSPGCGTTLVETEYGRIGVAICYDMRFPEFFRKMALEGAGLIIVPAAFNMTTGPAHWELTARARALDNQVFMALCSPARDTKGVYTAYGHSMVTDPWGSVVKSLDENEDILVVDLDMSLIEKTRTGLPLLKHRRPDIY